MTFRAAVIGLGQIGLSYTVSGERASHVSSYLANPKTELVGVADINDQKLEAFKTEYPNIPRYTDYETMLSRERPEIVSVCTPTETHAKIVRNCARFSSTKVIFCEKPIASTAEDAERMIRTCEQFGVKLAVNHSRRYDPAYRLLWGILNKAWRYLCDKGMQASKGYMRWDIGELLAFDGRFSSGRIREGVHMTDMYNWYKQANTEFSLLNIPTPYLVFEFDLIGSEGLIKIMNNGASIQLWKPKESERYAGIGLKELEHAATLDIKYDFSRAMLNAVEDLVECAQSEKQPECDGRRGLEALKLCHEVFKDGS